MDYTEPSHLGLHRIYICIYIIYKYIIYNIYTIYIIIQSNYMFIDDSL